MTGTKLISKNKRAFFNYEILEKLEVGIMLKGTEIKAIRAQGALIGESHISIDQNEELWAHNISIPHYEFGNIHNHEERRKRKLLARSEQIAKLKTKMKAEGLTIVPLSLYFKGQYVKIELGLGKGKKNFDKRQSEKKKEIDMKLRRRDFS